MWVKIRKSTGGCRITSDSLSKKRPAFSGNPDLRRGMQVPGPPVAEIEAKLLCWLTPESFKPLRLTTEEKKLRDRILTLPAIMAVVLSLV